MPDRVAHSAGVWLTATEAAEHLRLNVRVFRRMLDRRARRAPDGAVEARFDGVVARKVGRTWRVSLSEQWNPKP